MEQFPSSELVLNARGAVYHLDLLPGEIADTVILVGDQDRVAMVSSFFDSIEHRSQHREFCCHTGFYKGKRVSALSTGIGTDNIDITVNELDALANIDLVNRAVKPALRPLNLVRIGTCGILQPGIPVHSYILSSYAFGLDNIAYFYPIAFSSAEKQLQSELTEVLQLRKELVPYAVSADEELVKKLESEKTHTGITVTSSGFYAPQGRRLRLGLYAEGLNEKLTTFSHPDFPQVMNFEMESSALFALAKAMGHRATTICLGVANRPAKQFSKGYREEMLELIGYVLERV